MLKFALSTAVIFVLSTAMTMAQQGNVDCNTQRQLQIDNGNIVTKIVSAYTPIDLYNKVTDENGRSLTFVSPDLATPESWLAYGVGLRTAGFVVETSDGQTQIWGDYAHYGCWKFRSWKE